MLSFEVVMVIEENDVILSIARDDDSYTPNNGTFFRQLQEKQQQKQQEQQQQLKQQQKSSSKKANLVKKKPERILFCGWRRDLADMISHLDHIVPKGSELWLLNSIPVYQRRGLLEDVGQRQNLKLDNLIVKHAYGNPTIRKDLTSISCLDMFGDTTGQVVNVLHFDTIMVLADEFAMRVGSSRKSADGRSLATFLLLRDLRRSLLAKRPGILSRFLEEERTERIICEMLHASSSRMLLRELDCRGYVMSNRIVSSAMGQLLMNGAMNDVLAELLSPTGNEFSIKSVLEYMEEEEEEEEMSFWELADRALGKEHVLVGYKTKEEEFKSIVEMSEEEEERCTCVNPPDKEKKRRWRKEDVVVVLSRTRTFKK
eukprot:768725-Hanusia_phi.AAC.1